MNFLIKLQSLLFVLKWRIKKPFIILNKIRTARRHSDHKKFWDILSPPSPPNSPWGLWEEASFMGCFEF